MTTNFVQVISKKVGAPAVFMQMENDEEAIPTYFQLLPEELTSENVQQTQLTEDILIIWQNPKQGLLPNCRIENHLNITDIFYGDILFIRLAKGKVSDMLPDDLLFITAKIQTLPFLEVNLPPLSE
jgi:hypothetical protein